MQDPAGHDVESIQKADVGKPRVSFIQVRRDYLRYSVAEIYGSGLLKHWFDRELILVHTLALTKLSLWAGW